jgi:hypothetical protein
VWVADERQASPSPDRGSFNAREVPVGATIRLTNDATAEVIDNPQDGMWLLCRYLSSPDDPGQEGVTELVFVQNVVGVVE